MEVMQVIQVIKVMEARLRSEPTSPTSPTSPSSPPSRSSPHPLITSLQALLLTPALSHALEIESSVSRYADKRYHFEFVATLDAPIEGVSAVLRDYERYPELDARILNARIIERPAHDVVLLATTLRVCFGPFCRNVKRIERVTEAPHELTSIADPQRSDVTFGEAHTFLSDAAGMTRVIYSNEIQPDRWVPPLAGRRWLLNAMQDATLQLFRNVEKKAQAVEGGMDVGTQE